MQTTSFRAKRSTFNPTVVRVLLFVGFVWSWLLVVSAAAQPPPFTAVVTRTPDCAPSQRPFDGSCNSVQGLGIAGDAFIHVDGYEPASSSAPSARELSNQFFAQDPWEGIEMFETTLIPFEQLREGQNPQKTHGYRLNQFAVAFGQAVAHDMAKVSIGFNPAAISAPDFQYAPDDPLCQKVAEIDQVTIYYFPCTAMHTSDGIDTTVTLTDDSRYTLVRGATWSYGVGPFSITVPDDQFTHRKSTFPLASTLVPDETGATLVPVNNVTSFLDLSIIYGNNSTVNALLRANDGSGKLETADDGDIPFGKPGLANDCSAFDPVNNPSSGSGDSRVDENLFLQAVHSLFFRNHNRDAEWVAAHRPDLTTDEERFQRARAINIARYQQQVYNEYLPAVFGRRAVARLLGAYRGYNPSIDPRIMTTFDIALRIAHGQVTLPPYIERDDGSPLLVAGTLGFPSHSRANCLFTEFREVGGKAVATSAMKQSAQEVTGKVSDLMRNIVFRSGNNQATSAFNLDIEQLNIIRSREFGAPNFDALRAFWRGRSVYGLHGCTRAPEGQKDPLRCFRHVTKDRTIAEKLRKVYGHVDRIDAFAGLILENNHDTGWFRMPQTATTIILTQFKRTRAADWWFYLNRTNQRLDFSPAEWRRIHEPVAESLALSYGIQDVSDAFHVIR